MRYLLTFLFGVLLASVAVAGPETDAARKQAQRCVDALMKKDYDALISLTHPALIKAGGGKEALRKATEAAMTQVAALGIVFEKVSIGNVDEPKKVGDALVTLVQQTVTLRIPPNDRLTQESTLVGYSYDGGKNWVFADTGEMTEALFNQLFPDLKGVISLPKKKEPIIVSNDPVTTNKQQSPPAKPAARP